jgi:hypothetical protein
MGVRKRGFPSRQGQRTAEAPRCIFESLPFGSSGDSDPYTVDSDSYPPDLVTRTGVSRRARKSSSAFETIDATACEGRMGSLDAFTQYHDPNV